MIYSFYVAFLVVSLILNIVLAYKLYSFSIMILNIEDNLEDCLLILNEKHEDIQKILEKEVFFDSIEVRQTIANIKESHEAILSVSQILTQKSGIKIEEKKD